MSKSNKKLTTTSFINKARKYHEDKYTYDKVKYINSKIKVTITCPMHGDFEQTPSNHLKFGCAKCAGNVKLTTKDFIVNSIKVHNDKYDYSKVIYKNAKTKVEIICNKHGSFWQTPNDHTGKNATGCPKCSGNIADLSTFKMKASKIHNNYYDYSKSVYTTAKNDIVIVCPTHGEFQQSPNNHLSGNGCTACAFTGFNENKPAILYYLRIEHNNSIAYKIGITNRTVAQRYSNKDLAKITVLSEIKYQLGKTAREEETKIKREFSKYKWDGCNLLDSGNTELFSKDILKLDKKGKVNE